MSSDDYILQDSLLRVMKRLNWSQRRGRHYDLVEPYDLAVSRPNFYHFLSPTSHTELSLSWTSFSLALETDTFGCRISDFHFVGFFVCCHRLRPSVISQYCTCSLISNYIKYLFINSDDYNTTFSGYFVSAEGGSNIYLSVCPRRTCKKLENWPIRKDLMAKINFV